MRDFSSTRSGATVSFREALLQGLAPDGGLYVPKGIPALEAPSGFADEDLGFSSTARWAARALLGDALPPDLLDAVVADALDFPAPLVEVEPGVHVLELFHGPSLAFKDVGARFMARAMAALAGDATPRTVLVATSGDTGGAVAAAFHGLEPYRVVALFPRGGISERQRRQMTTLGGNVTAVAVDGTFDNCQRLAKGAFSDAALRRRCGLTSANSINIGRLVPQSFYYLHAARLLGWDAEPATFVVPSGNLQGCAVASTTQGPSPCAGRRRSMACHATAAWGSSTYPVVRATRPMHVRVSSSDTHAPRTTRRSASTSSWNSHRIRSRLLGSPTSMALETVGTDGSGAKEPDAR